ncbi:MAG: restriction endonuclease subunit S [Candidatus Nanopusillus acidilobi]|jgi:type I restriction enzyme S subunit
MEVVESGFKETEIGLIPEDWEAVRLGEVGNYINGYAFKPSDWSNTGKPIIRIQNLNNPSASFNYFNGELDYKYLVKKGDILISWSASLGAYLWNGEDAWLNQHIFKVELTNQNVAKDFLYFALLYYFVGQALANLHGSTMKHIVKSKFLNILIPLPPLEEQKAIADILSTVQNTIEKTEKVIDATKQLKKSMMKHLFTHGAVAVDEIDKVNLKESEIGLIPEHWEVVRLGDVMEGFMPNKKLKQSDYKAIGKFPVIDQGQEYVAGFYDDETMVFDKDLPVILFGDHTRIIKYVDFPFICGADGLKIIIPKENFHRKYFYYALLNLNIPSRGYNRHFKILKEKLIPLPPLDEQQKIANILATIDQKIQAEEKKKEALQNLFKTLLQQLMTGKIRVKKAKT